MSDRLEQILDCLVACEERAKRAADRVKSTRDAIAALEGTSDDASKLRASLAVYETALAAQCAILENLLAEVARLRPPAAD